MDTSERLSYVKKNTNMYLLSYLTLVIRKGNWREVARVRKQLRILLEKESLGFIVRSRFKENLESETASLFYLNRENKNYKKSSLQQLKIKDKTSSDKKEIESEVIKYFGALFNGHHDRAGLDTGQTFVPDYGDLPDFLQDLGSLSQGSQDKLVKNLDYEKVTSIVIKKCARNKSPGLDGLPYELYQVTWDIIGRDFVEVLQCQLDRVRLVESDQHGATRLTSKVAGIPAVCELRPITLLNCDYKILSKCFVGELAPVMGEIIKSGQLCSVKEKNILFGISNIMSSLDYVNAHNVPAFIASFDVFKACDRVMLDYLVKVMKAMKFPDKFIGWILMLHEGATTRFLLNFLTDPIKVLFSIRQGDPLSMLLYIIYIEPLLLMINKHTKGLCISNVVQRDEDYCDDINFVSEMEDDLVIIENIFTRFESVSGALLSRTWKSTVLGLGPWKNKLNWPLPWLRVKNELKIFGFQICSTYKQTLDRCWQKCYVGFNKVIMSWSSRQLETLVQRVEVLRLFATSKLWYKASALPLPAKFAKQFESAMFWFLRIGKLEKLKLDEIKNPTLSGGLNLPCVISKADSLFLSQTCRLLSRPDSRQYKHIKYWLGLYIKEYFPDMAMGPHSEIISPYFSHMKSLLTGGIILDDVDPQRLHKTTAKILYKEFASSFPPPKIVYRYDVDWSQVWVRLQSPMLEPKARELLFMVINNIVANRDRLFHKFNRAASPNCVACGVLQDNVHLFCECKNVREAWFWVRQRLIGMLPVTHGQTSNFELLNLMFESFLLDKEIIWMLGIFVQLVWDVVICKKKSLKIETVKSEYLLKFESHKTSKMPTLEHIVGFNL